jgi:hypothetical protein
MGSVIDDAAELEARSTLVHELTRSWFCYWDPALSYCGHITAPPGAAPAAPYAFRPPPQATTEGFVRFPAAGPPAQLAGVAAASRAAAQLRACAARLDARGFAHRSEADYPFRPLLLPWPPGAPVAAGAALARMGAHPELRAAVREGLGLREFFQVRAFTAGRILRLQIASRAR